MSKSVSVSVVVVSRQDDQVQAINTALRDAGHAVHCIKTEKLSELEAALTEHNTELIVIFGAVNPAILRPIVDTRNSCGAHVPLLLVCDEVNEEIIAGAINAGARDVVSLNNIERLQAVASRELRSCRLEKTLERVMNSATQYKNELNSLKQVTVDAIADIQEGIIVNANPSWHELFGRENNDDLTGHPIMDLCLAADRPTLKGALVSCQRGKWQDEKLAIKGIAANGDSLPIEISLETIDHDGEPAVRIMIAAEKIEEKTPVSLVEKAIQRDHVTGFFNRQHFLNTAAKRLGTAPSGGVRALAYVRPDRFTRALDDIGLMGTESAISQLAHLLAEYMQPTDIYGRFGGTMFVIMLERGTMSDMESWAEQLLQTIAATVFEHNDRSTAITCSIGLCEVDSKSMDIIELLGEAERACRTGRQKGGNRIELSESSGAAKKVRQDDTIWIPRIRGALMENRLRLEHQPIASLNDDIENAYDTLVRMLDEEGNTVLPSEFMPVAERTGLTKNIDRWVIGASFSFCKTSNAELVFIRLSRDSLLDETLLEWLKTQIATAKIAPGKICFELDEEIASRHMRQAQELATNMRKAGFKFAIEHCGKSNASNQVITKIPMEFVKIDGSLMQGLHKNASVQNKVKDLARLARDYHILTIAERVQDANTMAVLWQLGIAYIQGNYVQNREIIIEDTSQSSVTTLGLTAMTEAGAEA